MKNRARLHYFPLVALAIAPWLLPGCAAFDHPDAAPGFNHREVHALVEEYYWRAGDPAPSYSDRELSELLAKSVNQEHAGERAEEQFSTVVAALAAVGDE